MVSCVEGVQFGKCIGFSGMKPAADSDNNYVITKDLIRLDGFSKNAVDQATFYLTKLMEDGLYFMMELATSTLPSPITNLQQYLVQFDDVLYVLLIFEKYCKPGQYEELQVFDGRNDQVRAPLRSIECCHLSVTQNANALQYTPVNVNPDNVNRFAGTLSNLAVRDFAYSLPPVVVNPRYGQHFCWYPDG
ncbi:hypothetical protein BDB00DRAFT_897916 [Zychaea mexicana]|uniref:uncharacterized protein n=1 Tax=Zychaea mexicana TaxID=64656 RepID=UPI0022FDED13|nr:uncharacterized protein BDB00DRAFT_897916 [Zychaea mexicana]KAI9499106.1 hypothetical protein BDB00DRAFT_897916 [Zychaea mexicana]